MFKQIVFIVIFASLAFTRNVPRYNDLDENEQILFRAAYESPSYEHGEYQDEVDIPFGKLDLLKDGMWAIKAKIKEMKSINKALAANLLATKLQVKELLTDSLKSLKNHHVEVDKDKPVYYQVHSPQPAPYPHYEQPHYGLPPYSAPQYSGAPQYSAPPYSGPQYSAQQYEAPQYNKHPQYSHDPYYGH